MAEHSESTQSLYPKKVSTKHRAIMRHFIAGKTVNEVAEMFGMTVPRVSLIKNSPLFMEEMRKMGEDVSKEFVESEGSKVHTDLIRVRLKEEAAASLETLVRLRDGAQSERVKQLSAIELLNKAGYKEGERVEGELVLDASEGLVNALASAMKEMKQEKKPDVNNI